MDIGIIILAAGSSSRMGQSKQLLMVNPDNSLLLYTTKIALQVNNNVLVVLGSDVDVHKKAIQHLPVKIVFNTNWQRGIGSSIKTGLTKLMSLHSSLHAVLIMVCDQPLVTAAHLNNIISCFKENQSSIVASGYSGISGSPALFNHTLFETILHMSDGDGAKKIIQASKDVRCMPFEQGSIDLDTPEDYQAFLANK
jgi:molybdenum cofactor cytidylyltransferase